MSKKVPPTMKYRGAADELQNVPDLFYAFAEQFPGGMLIKDSKGRLLYMNPPITEHHGGDKWLTHTIDEIIDKSHARPLQESDRQTLENGPVDVEVTIPDRNGVEIIWRTIRFPIARPGKEPLIGVLALDVTETRRIQDELEEQRTHYQTVVENFPNGFICLFDRDNRYILARGKGLRLIGTDPSEFEGKTIYEVFPPETLKIVEQHHHAVLAGRATEYEIEVKGNFFEVQLLPIRDSSGEVHAGLAMIQLVTDRHRVRTVLHRRDQEYKALVENSRDIIARFDRNHRLLYMNSAFERITTLPLSWFMNMKLDELHMPSQTLQNFLRAMDLVFDTGELTSIEIDYNPKSGTKFFQVRLTPEYDPEGNVETVLAVARDITNYKNLERDLRRAKDEAEAANRAKSEFLANMSHEIRTPMNAMLGYMDLITAESLDTSEREYLGIVKDSAETLLTIINDILDYSKIEAGKIELEAKALSPGGVIKSVIKEHTALADQKGLELSFSLGENLPASLVGDITRLKQILRNLISNALKFTERGSVRVRADMDEAPAPPGMARLRFSVTDTGVGLSPELKDKLFESFTQVNSGMRRKYVGTGLGLAICKKLSGLLGGNIWADSEPGQGSTFSFTALFERTSSAPEPQPEERDRRQSGQGRPSLPGLRILLAEDNEINRAFLTELLKENGHTVGVAVNGEEVLEKLKAGDYDIVLMDVQMPEMDGMEATRAIRESKENGLDPHIPVIGLSAYAMSEHRDRFIKAGMNDFVSKPVNFDVLFKTIAKVLSNPGRPVPEPEPEPPRPAKNRRREDELLDIEGITDHYSHKGKMFIRLTDLFFESARDNMTRIKSALKDKSLTRIEKLAHAIRGSSASMGAQALTKAAASLEEAAVAEDHQAVAEKVQRLEAVLEPSIREMSKLRDTFDN